ncbi:MAG: hypothetical protein H0W50_05365 [Parachlamydiaceae bacterium]|nr:hypothetical protein [Parachlamydiaceae bacterium]
MAVDPYANGYTPTSTIESFPTPPKGSLEFDLDQVVKKQNQKKRYSESMSSYNDLPSFKTADSPAVAPPALAQLSSSKVGEKKGFLKSAWDQICLFFWGPSTSTGAAPAADSNEAGSMIGSTPRLAASGAEWKKTQATMERLTQLMEDANKIIDDLQGESKEGVQMDEVAERFKTNWDHFYITLLKKQTSLSEKIQLGNSEEITTIHQVMKTVQEGIQAAALNKGNLDSKMWWYEKIGNVANVGSAVSAVGMTVAHTFAILAGTTVNPIAAGVALAGGVISAAIKGATSLLEVYLKRQKIAEEGKIKIGQHRRQDASIRIKDRVHDDKTVRATDTTAVAAMAQETRSKTEMTRMLQQLSN